MEQVKDDSSSRETRSRSGMNGDDWRKTDEMIEEWIELKSLTLDQARVYCGQRWS